MISQRNRAWALLHKGGMLGAGWHAGATSVVHGHTNTNQKAAVSAQHAIMWAATSAAAAYQTCLALAGTKKQRSINKQARPHLQQRLVADAQCQRLEAACRPVPVAAPVVNEQAKRQMGS